MQIVKKRETCTYIFDFTNTGSILLGEPLITYHLLLIDQY